MKVLIIGSTGTIGRAVADALSARHDVVRVGHSSGDVRVDITDSASIEQLLESTGRVDAVVSAAGNAYVGPLAEMTQEQLRLGLEDKLLGQMSLARLAIGTVNDGGSITLSSGLASRTHRPGWSAGLEAFVRSAATEMPRQIRTNVVSPGIVLESIAELPQPNPFTDAATPVAEVALAYVRSVEGRDTGCVIDTGRI